MGAQGKTPAPTFARAPQDEIMDDVLDPRKLTDTVSALVEAAKRAGADAADAVAVRGRSASVSVRLGKVESTDASEGDDMSLRVFVGKRVASVSATASSDPQALAERAVAMARVSPEDPYQGLADAGCWPRRSETSIFTTPPACRRPKCASMRLPRRKQRWLSPASPIPVAAAPARAWADWSWPRRMDFSGTMSDPAFHGRSA